jgi:cellobiose epimerase
MPPSSRHSPSPWHRLLVLSLGLALLSLLGACDMVRGESQRIDVEWQRRSLVDGHLARWLAAAPMETGAFRTVFDRHWVPKAQQPGDLTGHSRLVYVMVTGYEVTRDKRYLDAAVRGGDFMLKHFQDPVHGGFFYRVSPEGKPLAEHKNTYGHAFAMYALSHLYRVTRDERYRTAALATWQTIDRSLRDPHGGFRGDAPRDFLLGAPGNRSQNPVMHLFEALLALVDATQDPAARAGAASVGHFVVYKLMQGQADGSAFIPEWYDTQWKPIQSKDQGGYVDLGHQFEWSHLLLGAERRGLSAIYPQAAERLLAYALKTGYDEIDGGAYNRVYADGTVDRTKHWWQQAECLHALQAAAVASDKKDLWRRYDQTLALVREQFIDAEHGGWYFGLKKKCLEGGCPPEHPDPYHMTSMHMAAIQWAQSTRP